MKLTITQAFLKLKDVHQMVQRCAIYYFKAHPLAQMAISNKQLAPIL